MKTKVVAIRHAPHESLGTFEGIIQSMGFELVVAEVFKPTGGHWADIVGAPVLILMGGPMGVYEAGKHPFLLREIDFLRHRIESNLPTLGICLGAQLIAQAAGSTVFKSGRHEVGWFPVSKALDGKDDSVVKDFEWKHPVFHWHGDTFGLPKGARHLLRSNRFEQQAFAIGERVYGFQFHPEIIPAELPQWFEADPNLPYGTADGVQSKDEIIKNAATYEVESQKLSETLLKGFFDLIFR